MRKIAFVLSFSIGISFASPQQIILVPHAEKSATNGNLTATGYKEAQTLRQWLLNHPNFKPNVIIANSTPENRARGSIETCEPIAHDLKIPVNSQFLGQEVPMLTNALLTNKIYDGKTILICWDQHSLTQVALSLGAENLPTLKNTQQGYLLKFSNSAVAAETIAPYQSQS